MFLNCCFVQAAYRTWRLQCSNCWIFFIFLRFSNSEEVGRGGGGQIVTLLTGSVKEEGAARAVEFLKL